MVCLTKIRWWRWLPYPRKQWRTVLGVDAADEIPDRIPGRSAVIVGSQDSATWIAFDCPCKRKHRVMLNLDPRRRPTWRLASASPLTLFPSVDDHSAGVRCHYFVREGKINWVPKTDERR